DSPQRVRAGIQYTLSEAADNGHCYLPEPNLIADAAEILTVPADLVRTCLDELAASDGVVREPVPNPSTDGGSIPAVYLVPFHRAETSLAGSLLRLLQVPPGGDSSFDRASPLDADLVVVDESSMLDLILANKLVKAIPAGAHLLLVGDVDQLPSVGAGEVLRDVLAAQTIPRVRLTKIFRQAQQSGVVVNAHRINAGQPPVFGEHPDFFLFPADEPEATADLVVDLIARRIPARFGLASRDIQVLTPMHRGPAGAGNLNTLLQQTLAPYREGAPE